MGIEITVAKSFSGDCIWIRYGHELHTNIIIDSGPAAFKKGFREVIQEIASLNELVDLLVLTHIDDDHIKGFEGYLAEGNDCSIIKKIMFNSGIFVCSNLHSPDSAIKLIDELKKKR